MTQDSKAKSAAGSWVPFALMAVAAASAYAFSTTNSGSVQRYAGAAFGISLGGALLFWGVQELLSERIRGTRVYVNRRDSPIVFFSLLAGKRFVPGLAMLIGGISYFFRNT